MIKIQTKEFDQGLVIEVEGRSGLPLLIGGDELGYDERVLRPAGDGVAALVARTITPEKALIDYMEERKLGRLSQRLQRSGVLDVVATAAPGIDDLLVLGKVKQIERSGAYDLVIVDGPAAGHAVSFLQSARGLADAVTVGPISTQARDVLEMLGDATLPGKADPARGDTGQRADRDGLRARGSGGHQPRAPRRQRPLRRAR
jgi:anion-transporting  ArsA/GET3 family ATPase